jgi:tetratricopeptide (TPR) repeat protein
MLNSKRTYILILLLFIAVVSNAQQGRINAAFTFLQQGNLDSAKSNIDLAVVHPETQNDGQAWYVRGFVYKSIYNKNEKANKLSDIRLEALHSFKKSMLLDTSQQNSVENVKNIKYLATTLYNDVVASLDTINYQTAVTDFAVFKEYYLLVDPSAQNFKQKDIDFFNAIASVYNKLFEADRKGKLHFLDSAKAAYNKTLLLDPNNFSANYNMAILYYNQAVNLINQSDFDLDIVALNDVQDNSINLFKASLPFMEKAYTLDPERPEPVLGLSGIYFSLNDKEKAAAFKTLFEKIQERLKKNKH